VSDLDDQLDNPAWWALRGAHRPFALESADGRARRYRPDVALFGAVDQLDDQAWVGLRELAGPGAVLGLFRAAVGPVPDDWTEVFRGRIHQMVAPTFDAEEEPGDGVDELDDADAPAMLELARAARPGPFETETHRLGTFLGVRVGDRLVAMAGERFRLDGATEISAVCTAEAARRQGWGARLTRTMARRIQARGDVAFLHVEDTNDEARRLYEGMGFTTRTFVEVVAMVRSD